MNFYTYSMNWLDNFQSNRMERSTYFNYRNELLKLFRFSNLASRELNEITSVDIQNFIDTCRNTPYSFNKAGKPLFYRKASIQKTITCLKSLFKYALFKKHIIENPMEYIYLPREKDMITHTKVITPYSTEDCRKIINAVINERKYCLSGLLIVFLLETGLRIGEALAVQHEDINYSNRTISITKQFSRINSPTSLELKHYLKTKSGRREVPLTPIAERVIELLPSSSGFLFTRNGKPINQRAVSRELLTIERKECLEKRGGSLHVLRHTFASNCLMLKMPNGDYLPTKMLSKWLGHSSIQITLDIYADVIKEREQECSFVLNSLYA